MHKWLDNNILMYSKHNEVKSVLAERFIKTLKSKINKWMTDNKNPIDADYSILTENNKSTPKARKFKGNDRVRITKYKNIFSEDYTEKGSREIFIIDSVLEINPWIYKIKDLNGVKIIRSFMKKNFCEVYYKWVIIQNQAVILKIKLK